ncbi:hypothetical protein ACTFIZ_008937 [Dictyostelium cf. discoideum]
MNFKSIILLLSFLYFLSIVSCLKTEDISYYQDGEKLVFNINPNLGFNDRIVISEYPSIESKGKFNLSNPYLNMPFFNLNNGSVSYNLTLLKLSPNSLPYKAYLSPFADGYNYTLYFNLFAKTNYCSKENFYNAESFTYQSCINGGKNNNTFSQAGDLFEASYNISQIDLVRINYKATQFNYGCSRNTWFNIYCDLNHNFKILNMSANICHYEVNILSSHACPLYSSIPYNQVGNNTYELNIGPLYNPTDLYYYINGSLVKFALNSTSQSTPSPTLSETPSPTPSETPSPTPSETPSSTPSETPSPTPSETPSPTPSETPSPTPSETPSPTPSETPSPTPSETPSSTPSETPSPTPSETPSSTPSETPSPTPSETPSPTPSETPSPTPSETPSSTPSETPSPTPSETPSPTPSETPSPTPSETPSPTPSETPSPTPSSTPVPSPKVYCRSNRYGITINSTETVSCRGFGKTKCITKLGSECSTDNLDGEIVCTSKSLQCFGTNIQCISGDVYCSIDF